ncbi:MAG: zinc-ribbon domain-containing protein, partial [Polyangiales bacterium]
MPPKTRPMGVGAKRAVADFPTVAAQWHPTKNKPLKPADALRASSKRVWWKCPKGRGHEWLASPNTRIVMGAGCPFCSGRLTAPEDSLPRRRPHIAAEWSPRNNREPSEVRWDMAKAFWWKCPKGRDHEWRASVAGRTLEGDGCPCCAGYKLSVTNSLAKLKPAIAREWHPTKNGKLTPRDVTVHSAAHVWWRCLANPKHVWRTTVNLRARRETGCPECWKEWRPVLLPAMLKEAARRRKRAAADRGSGKVSVPSARS